MTEDLARRLANLDSGSLPAEHARIVDVLTAASRPLDEDVADFLPCRLQQTLRLEPLRQRHRLEGARIYTVTYVLMPGVDPAAIEAALTEKEWDWWKNGRISEWRRRDDGRCTFVLAPVWPFVPTKVGIELQPRVTGQHPTPWGSSVSIASLAARFFADFEGPGRYEILSLEGGSALRSRWDGVVRLGFKKLMPMSMILDMHLGAEAGTVGFPFPKGTGFPGLVKRLSPNGSA